MLIITSLFLLAIGVQSTMIEKNGTSYITNGENVNEAVTFYGYLEIFRNGVVYFGGSALISPRAAITVAQNVEGFSAWRIGLAGIRIRELTWHEVTRTTVHPQYNATTLFNNIAVLELNEAVTAPTLRIPPSGVNFPIRDTIGEVVGFGFGLQNVQPEVLQATTWRVLRQEECGDSYPHLVAGNHLNNYFCAMNHDQHSNICAGDQGGPIYSRVLRYLFGLASFIRIEDCNSPDSSPAAFVRLSEYFDWLEPYRNLV